MQLFCYANFINYIVVENLNLGLQAEFEIKYEINIFDSAYSAQDSSSNRPYQQH